MSDCYNEQPTSGIDNDIISNDSDAEGSLSICSDTHSDNTVASGVTEKSSLSGSTIHASLGSDDITAVGSNALDPNRKTHSIFGSQSSSRHPDLMLPWGAHKERTSAPMLGLTVDIDIRPGEYVMRSLFADFTIIAEKKIDCVLNDSQFRDKPLSKALQRGEDVQFDQLLSSFGSVAEHCLPSLLRALFSWYERQMSEAPNPEQKRSDPKQKSIIQIVSSGITTAETVDQRSEAEIQKEKRDLAVEFIFCLVLIEVLKQLSFHPGHEDLVQYIENLAFKHFKYKEGIQINPNGSNIHIIADLYAEVIGVLAQSRFMSVRTRFMNELKELRTKEASPYTTQSIISLLMGMKFFRVKMVPIEEFEASFQFMQECAQYFLEVKDKDIKHALAGLFVEILVPVAAAVKNEVNVPCLKHFVETLFYQTLDASSKSKHRLALFPLVTCLLCVSQKQFFLHNWPCFLTICLQQLKNRDPKMCRVALESLYRLIWVYMIRIKCESNSATQSRLQSIVNSLFPKGSKGVVPRDTPLNIFVKIIQFIAQERLDFAMREIVFDLLSIGRPIKIILTPERMSIGLRAFLVVADSLQQKEGEPPMPRSVGVLPSGNTLRVRKTFLNKVLTEDTARTIGMSAYFPHVRRVFVDILRALDTQYGRPLMMTNTQNAHKEPDEMITGERKPKIDLFRTCVAAVPRLIPDGMTGSELVDLLSRLTVHMDEELRGLAYQSLQTLVIDFPDWRHDVIFGITQFLVRDVLDTFPQLVDNGLKMILTLLIAWKNACVNYTAVSASRAGKEYNEFKQTASQSEMPPPKKLDAGSKLESLMLVLHLVEALVMVMLCNNRLTTRRVSILILKEVKALFKVLNCHEVQPAIDIMDKYCRESLEKYLHLLPPGEKTLCQTAPNIDMQWLSERNNSVWTAGLLEDGSVKSGSNYSFTIVDPWSSILFDMLDRKKLVSQCSVMVFQSWPIVFQRLNTLFSVVDPTPLNDNRASLLRSSTAVKKPPSERDGYMHLWKNYITFASRVIPHIPNSIIRCASPDLSLSSNPDSLSADKSDKLSHANVSPTSYYKLIVPLLRCEASDIRDSTVYALGYINGEALRDLLEELIPYVREAIDKKQENVRRRRRRDALRLQLTKMFEEVAEKGTFSLSSCSVDKDSQTLNSVLVEFLEGVRYFLDNEPDKNSSGVKDLTLHFCCFIKKMIKNFNLETRCGLIKRDLRKNLFMLFSYWAGKYGAPFSNTSEQDHSGRKLYELQYVCLQTMSSLLTSGPCFDTTDLSEDGNFYSWLDTLINSNEEKVYNLAQETVILLLESNPDIGFLLDWVVDKCYTGKHAVADGCFLALAYIFSTREYPCDHYTAVINVTLMNTGCPRTNVRDTALQLLQILDKRFFWTVSPLSENDQNKEVEDKNTLDSVLATTFCRSQIHLSGQLAQLHPELTMPMFSEITYRFQLARPDVRLMLLDYILPWLHNMELVDPNICSQNANSYQYYPCEISRNKREGWGSAEATEMVLNNIFYLTAKFGDNHPKEIEMLWATLCTSWPNNMRVIIRYLIIISGMAPTELLSYAKRVVLYMARVQSGRLFEEMMIELQTVETLNCLIERTETPPFYRLTMMRKTSSHSEGNSGAIGQVDSSSRNDLNVEKGTIHTKRHSGEDPSKMLKSETDKGLNDYSPPKLDKSRNIDSCSRLDEHFEEYGKEKGNVPISQPHPLPMPEYGGYFAPLCEYLPDSSQPISGFHRCNVAIMLLCDVVIDGLELDWTIHVPLMLHVAFLGLDHTRNLVHQHCKQLLLNLLLVVAQHNDHLTVAQILLTCKTNKLELGLSIPSLSIIEHNYTEPDPVFDSFYQNLNVPSTTASENPSKPASNISSVLSESDEEQGSESNEETKDFSIPPVIVSPESGPSINIITTPIKLDLTVSNITKSLIHFLASRNINPLWNYEDITAKVWNIRSAEQMEVLLQHIVRVFRESIPLAHVNERWAQTALQLGLSCSSRHYAGRSLQIYRALKVPITSRMLSDILSRLVETIAEQGEDMQGYVTELLLTLEAAVDSLESDFRPLDYMKDFFKSTPNLNNKEIAGIKKPPETQTSLISQMNCLQACHTRSTSYSVSYGFRKSTHSPVEKEKIGSGEFEHRTPLSKFASNLARSRSAQSLKLLGDSSTQDDKMTILAQLFWLAVSLLESDYEHEFLLAVRLLNRVLHRLPLDRPDARDKVEKLQSQLRWTSFPGVHALLLKGCTHPNIYEPVVNLLSQLTLLLNISVIDPSQSIAFPMNVIALLPYFLLNYEDANDLCIRSAENIAQVSIEKSKKLENLATVMNLYSLRKFSKESFQWTKCVIKYLYDTYAHLSLNMLTFLVEILEKGPNNLQLPILNIIHCILHYVDLGSTAFQPINTDLLKVVVKHVDGIHWKEALKILKLVVTRSSSLVTPPVATLISHWESSLNPVPHTSFSEDGAFSKKELPGRTMEFTFDLSQTPVIGRKYLTSSTTNNEETDSSSKVAFTPRRSCSLSPADAIPQSGWKRPWMCQGRVRECLVNLLTTCGQRVGLPKSPSVIFSQTSDLVERQSSMASSTEEMSLGNNDISGSSRRNEAATDFGVFKDFDFLEYESESIEGDSTDNFNWGVRRRPLSQGEEEGASSKQLEDSVSEKTPVLRIRKKLLAEESSDEEIESESPLDEIAATVEFESHSVETGSVFPSSLNLREHLPHPLSSGRSDTSGSSAGDLGEVTPCNASPNSPSIRSRVKLDILDNYNIYLENLQAASSTGSVKFFHQLRKLIKVTCTSAIEVTRESCSYMTHPSVSCLAAVKLISSRLHSMIEIVSHHILARNMLWFNLNALGNAFKERLCESLIYGMLEIQEHLETFCDKKQQVSMYCDAVKTTLKLELLSGQKSDFRHDQYLLDLGKAIFKLYFQLLLLVETENKIITLLYNLLISAEFRDITPQMLSVESALKRAFEDTEADGGIATALGGSVDPADSHEATIEKLLNEEKWTLALFYLKVNRNEMSKEFEDIWDQSDDINTLLNIYCRKIMTERPDHFVITNCEIGLADVFSRLYQVSAAVSEFENTMKDLPSPSKSSDSKK